jgi:hypothetical protein
MMRFALIRAHGKEGLGVNDKSDSLIVKIITIIYKMYKWKGDYPTL